MHHVIRCGVAVLTVVAACSAGSEPVDDSTRVVEVIDGDTVDVRLDGALHRVRLIGINAPESDECFAAEAEDALRDLLEGAAVVLVADRSDQDRYDRLLRYIELGSTDVGETLVAGGFAIARRYPPDTARADRYEAAQDRAERDGLGLWAPSACGEAAPLGGQLVFGAVRFDAEGPDAEHLNDEWVRIDNTGSDAVALTGWVLRDESSSNRFSFPDGFELDAGASVTVHTGCGEAAPDHLYWCQAGAAVWNNDGDTAFLLDPSGNVVATSAG